ncbi:MAG TPA: UDP-N-acetylmuramoyl-L-alanyl-D-glutamate--2,6-diaminopimelate ligase [Pyrinomonadaceae bacterium]|nr:UDP-N-acetylmuramoyl-L-alanyl-D-glutamate--2,6-diaminopimelate ligase [Pyrinomonadaceae bacterium]
MSESNGQWKKITIGNIARAVNGRLSGDADVPVRDVTHDSRQAGEGWLFAAVRGANLDAHQFIADVIGRGAVGVISELERPADFAGAWIQVDDVRRALALAAAEVHGHPSRALNLVGVTGTNGKTTTAFLIAAMAKAAGEDVALASTIEYRIGDEQVKAERTTPEASDIERFLRRAVDANCGVAVMEASSQALELHRCDRLHYRVAVFTNLTRDHLDYHGTMENYFAAKHKLFDGSLGEPPGMSVINIDDEYGARLAAELKERSARVITYALDEEADVSAGDIEFSFGGMGFNLRTSEGARVVRSPLVGRPHVYNILAAVGTCQALGIEVGTMKAAIEDCAGAPGRFERVAHRGDFAVVVDYAHTDDALANVIKTARGVTPGRVITVFGCGGDRDRTKRAPMGEVAALLSDVVIVTSDNPRTEDPEAILADIEVGLRATGKTYRKIADRREAIIQAIDEARTGDMVLIAGKGHEDYQIIGQDVIHFDDREVAREALAGRGL